jgi:hypothetical protein
MDTEVQEVTALFSKKSSENIAEVSAMTANQLETIAEISSSANQVQRMAKNRRVSSINLLFDPAFPGRLKNAI